MGLPSNVDTIVLTGTYLNVTGIPLTGHVNVSVVSPVTDATGEVILGAGTTSVNLDDTGSFAITLPCTNNTDLNPVNFSYLYTEAIPGLGRAFYIQLPSTLGSTASIAALSPSSGTLPTYGYLPLPSGTIVAGYVPAATGSGYATEWAPAGGGTTAVYSVFGRTGIVVAASGDYDVSEVTGAAPLSSPALTGIPTAPTASALTDSTQLATTAYADAAVSVETSRAEAAEALLAPLASPALTGVPTAPTAASGTDTTQLATTAFATTAADNAQAGAEAASVAIDGATMMGPLSPAVVSLTFGTAVSVDATLGNVFSLAVNGSACTISSPSGGVDGQLIRLRIGSGGSAVTWGTGWDFGTAGAPSLSSSGVDLVAAECDTSATLPWRAGIAGLGYGS